MQWGSDRKGLADIAVALVLVAATTAYLTVLPRHLGAPDEAFYLHPAKRVLDGEVLYRDIFELTTPGWIYAMALLFSVFGTTLTTARITAAIIHGLVAGLVYLSARRLGVRRALAGAGAFAYVALAPLTWPIASQHWLVTLFAMLLFFVCLRSSRHWFLAGALGGMLIAAHQVRGGLMVVAAVLFMIYDTVFAERNEASKFAAIARRAAAMSAGGLVVLVPLLAHATWSAGIDGVFQALIVQPLKYQAVTHCSWGYIGWSKSQASFTFPRLLAWLPLPLIIVAARFVGVAVQSGDRGRLRPLALTLIFCAGAAASIMYYPDFIHIAFIAPLFLVAALQSLDWLFRRLPERAGSFAVWTVVVLVSLWGGLHLRAMRERLWQTFPIPYDTPFGRVDLSTADQMHLYEKLRELLHDVPSRVFFCYPFCAEAYLLLDARNPTAYEFILPGAYTTPDQVADIIKALDATAVPYVTVNPALVKPGDPVGGYLRDHYEPLPNPARLTERFIYRRKASPGSALF